MTPFRKALPSTLRAGALLAVVTALGAAEGAGHAGGDVNGDSGGGWWPWTLFGRLHVLTVHFPIALLSVVLIMEVLRWRTARAAPNPVLTGITVIAALSAAVASVMGWANAGTMNPSGTQADLIMVHRWLGIATAVLALLVAGMAVLRLLADHDGLRGAYLCGLVLTVLGVSVTGHYGGLIVHGVDYLTSPLPWHQKAEPMVTRGKGTGADPQLVAHIDFATQIAPIFKKSCYECHNDEKQKGDLRMDTPEDLAKGGEHGSPLNLDKPEDSLLIRRVRGLGDKPRMPKKKDPLSADQIELIVRWIAQGAQWYSPPDTGKGSATAP